MSRNSSSLEVVEIEPASRPDAPGSMPCANGLLLVLSAPSGGGKTTLGEQLMKTDQRVRRAVTCTTRAPRAGEREGVDYYFLEPANFQFRAAQSEFLEHALVHGHHYGTLKSEVLSKFRDGFDVLLSVDVQGAAALKSAAQQDAALQKALVTVFLAPPSLSILEQRLRSRGTDAEGVIQRRLSGARAELARWREYDYLIMSEAISSDLRRMQSIVEAERLRSTRVVTPTASLQ